MNEKKMAEKRYIKRRLKRLNVVFGNEKPSYYGFTVDISETGIFLKSARTFPPHTTLTVEISIPGDDVAAFMGTVMWAKAVPSNLIYVVKKAGMGIRITRFLKGEKEYLQLVETAYH